MKLLTPLRQEFFPDADAFEATHAGHLRWIDLIQDVVGERIDRLAYTTEAGEVEHVLSVQGSMGTRLTFFPVEFSNKEAREFLQEQAESLMERLRVRRQQELHECPSQQRQGA